MLTITRPKHSSRQGTRAIRMPSAICRICRILLLAVGLFLLPGSHCVSAQEAASDGWQGPRPIPPVQQETPMPVPQSRIPSGKQVLEIPVQPQQRSALLRKRQAALPPPRLQPRGRRPNQLVTVTVTDFNGGYVPGLRPQDFTLYVDGVPQEITYFNTGQSEPVSMGLIVDSSGSMRNKIRSAGQALRGFIDGIKRRDEVFVEEFNVQPSLLQDFTDSRMLLGQAISLLRPGGGTSLYDAILDGIRRVRRGRHQKKALVVMTDGLDTASLASLNQTLGVARGSGVLIYTIGIGNPQSFAGGGNVGIAIGPFSVIRGGFGDERVDAETLREISDETGGKHFLLNTADVIGSRATLARATQTISQEMRNQYSIGYASRGGEGRYRQVRVESRRDDVVVRTQRGHAE
jgi:Ca-activated chloride channel family protein